MNIIIKQLRHCILIEIVGHFNATTTLSAQPIFNELIQHIDKNVFVDLSETIEIDTSGIGALVYLFKRVHMAGFTLELIGIHGQPLSKIKDLGLNYTIKISSLSTNNKKLIVFGEDWGRYPSSTQHLISCLLDLGWQVVWINSLGMRKPVLNWSYLKRLYEKFCQYLQRNKISKQRTPKNISVVYPIVIPIYGNYLIDALNRIILRRQLTKLLIKKKMECPIIWSSLPTAYPYLKIFQNCPIVYYCCDEFSVFEGIEPRKIIMLEKKLIDAAQLIIVSSSVIAQKMPSKKTIMIDHGVNIKHFQKLHPRPHDLPKGKPIAGFFGSLSSWVDINLLFACASKLPDWNFVLIGPKTIDLTELERFDNVYYLGKKSYQKLPAYVAHWDVSLLPFLINQHTIACNPMQVKEYLVCAHPIVSIEIPALEALRPYIYLAKNETEFVNAIKTALHDNNQLSRKNIVKNLGWDTKAILIEKKLLELENQL